MKKKNQGQHVFASPCAGLRIIELPKLFLAPPMALSKKAQTLYCVTCRAFASRRRCSARNPSKLHAHDITSQGSLICQGTSMASSTPFVVYQLAVHTLNGVAHLLLVLPYFFARISFEYRLSMVIVSFVSVSFLIIIGVPELFGLPYLPWLDLHSWQSCSSPRTHCRQKRESPLILGVS